MYVPRTSLSSVDPEINGKWESRGWGLYDNNNRVYSAANRPHSWGTGGPNNSDGKEEGSVYYRY